MKKILFISFCSFLFINVNFGQEEDKDILQVKALLNQQAECWNRGDIPAFMEGYWKSGELQFVGSSRVTYGWEPTLKNYQKRYPNQEKMGELTFEILNVTKRSRKVITLVGKFHLKRNSDDLSGHFLLVFQKKRGKWRIVADCTA